MDTPVGVVRATARYPVKSLRGEWRPAIRVGTGGVEGDRVFALYGRDGRIASGKTTRRFRRMPNLLQLSAHGEGGATRIRFPSGDSYPVDHPALEPALSALVGEPVAVRREHGVRHLDDSPVHLVTTTSLADVPGLGPDVGAEAARFRPNVVIDVDGGGRVEDAWPGRTVLVGGVRLRVTKRTERCVMPTQAQGDLPPLPGLLRQLAGSACCLGVYADVERPGVIRVDDAVRLLD